MTMPTSHDLRDAETRDFLLEAAVAAPSVHNSQPWLFDVGPEQIDVYADRDRKLGHVDPDGRYLTISCAAAVFNLRVAGTYLGFHPRVTVLPSADPTHIARVDLSHRHLRPGALAALYASIGERRTNRYPFSDRKVPHAVLSQLAEAVWLENAVLRVYDEQLEVDRIIDLLREAEFEEMLDPAMATEREGWVSRTGRGEGIPAVSLGPRAAEPHSAYRDLGDGRGRPVVHFEQAPVIAVLSTLGDAQRDWVRAGQALQRTLLVATKAGLSSSFLNQPLEYPALRWLVRSPLTGHGYSQMLIRFGYGTPVPPTPRRPVRDVVR